MRAIVTGTVVEKDRNEWAFNGRSGVAFSLLLRSEGASAAQPADRIKVSAEQFGTFAEGEDVELPVVIFANTVERSGVITGAKVSASVESDYVHTGARLHSATA